MSISREQRHQVIRRVVGNHTLSLWIGPDWQLGRAQVVQGHGGGSGGEVWHQVEAHGVEAWIGSMFQPEDGPDGFPVRRKPDELIRWTEIRDVVQRGATPELVEYLRESERQWGEHNRKWDLPPGKSPDDIWTPEERQQQWDEYRDITRAMSLARDAIIDAGFAREVEQETLFDLGF